MDHAFGIILGTLCLTQGHKDFSPVFSSRKTCNFNQLSNRVYCTLPRISGQTISTTCGQSV